ncbi:MAG: peptidoglycan D,D-transpeptidase FtsI family protein [Chloroflexota bacterium]
MQVTAKDRRRLLVLLVLFVALAAALGLRLAWWQVVRGDELRARALVQLARPAEIPAVRGTIHDRNGTILALTTYRDRLAAYPKLIPEEARTETVQRLAGFLGLTSAQEARLAEQVAAGGEYVLIDRAIDEAESERIRAAIDEGTLTGVGLEPQPFRIYPVAGGAPRTTLASRLLGFVSLDGKGSFGIEQEHDALLAGSPRVVEASRDRFGRPLGSSARIIEPGRDGADITLTIDAQLQLRLEKELYAAWVADKAKRVSGVILDPATGEVLAWATVPGYDANDYAADWARDPGLFPDPIAGLVYEPGSVMKMLTAAAVLDAGRVRPGSAVYDARKLEFDPYVVRNADHKAMGRMSFRDAIAYSRNVATARTATRLGRTTARAATALHAMWERLGIGSRTGVGTAAESAGIAADPAERPWAPLDLANRSFGQSVLVTQIQLAAAYAPMVNGGFRVHPRLVTAAGDAPIAAPEPERIFTPAVAADLRGLLDHVTGAIPWYAEGSLIRGWQVGGKTGTAQIWRDAKGAYSKHTFNFSFVGYVGGDRPEAVVAVRIEEARARSAVQGQIEIEVTSYQLFRRVAQGTIEVLGIPRAGSPGAGFPEPLSPADRALTPNRYVNHRAELAAGNDPRLAYRARYRDSGEPAADASPGPSASPTPGADGGGERGDRDRRGGRDEGRDERRGRDGRRDRPPRRRYPHPPRGHPRRRAAERRRCDNPPP